MCSALQSNIGYANSSVDTTTPYMCNEVSCTLSECDHFYKVKLVIQETSDILLATDCIVSACNATINVTKLGLKLQLQESCH